METPKLSLNMCNALSTSIIELCNSAFGFGMICCIASQRAAHVIIVQVGERAHCANIQALEETASLISSEGIQ